VLIGRNNRRQASWFRGMLDDVKIYSSALTAAEVLDDAHASPRAASLANAPVPTAEWDENACVARPPDARVAGLFVAFGLLVAMAFAGIRPTSSYRIPAAVLSLAAGFLILPSIPDTLPDHYSYIVPLLTLAGGLAAVMSMRSRTR
jgi:hypothetical protein